MNDHIFLIINGKAKGIAKGKATDGIANGKTNWKTNQQDNGEDERGHPVHPCTLSFMATFYILDTVTLL